MRQTANCRSITVSGQSGLFIAMLTTKQLMTDSKQSIGKGMEIGFYFMF